MQSLIPFQSYYSLIFNLQEGVGGLKSVYFNPIIVLFLTLSNYERENVAQISILL